MSFNIFSVKNKYYKNGIWWFTKMFNRILGQQRYDQIRVSRRIISNKFYYFRQQYLYRCFVESPDVANMLGIYPKVDTSHGYPYYNTYEMYRDFQQNTLNSDGSFGMWILLLSGIYSFHFVYNYMIPWYWNKNQPMKNGQAQRLRMRDAINTTILEQQWGLSIMQWAKPPHSFHYSRARMMDGLSHPDDVRAMHMSTLNRRNRYREHYIKRAGDEQKKMIGPN